MHPTSTSSIKVRLLLSLLTLEELIVVLDRQVRAKPCLESTKASRLCRLQEVLQTVKIPRVANSISSTKRSNVR